MCIYFNSITVNCRLVDATNIQMYFRPGAFMNGLMHGMFIKGLE